MESTANSKSDSPTAKRRRRNSKGSRGQAAELPQRSKGRSRKGQAKDDTGRAGLKPAGSEVGLSILQAGFDQALDEGVRAKVKHIHSLEFMPHHVIMIEVWNAIICPNCQAWTEQTICPACQSQIG